MKQLFLFIIALVIFWSQKPNLVLANESQESARIVGVLEAEDWRVAHLYKFLADYNSPLTDQAGHFVREADRLNLDWRLVVAIAGVESTFGKHIPTNSFNAWGWGVFTEKQDGIHFQDWADGITTVSEGLRENYLDKGRTTVEEIGRIYAASPVWANKVRFFLGKIDNFTISRVEHLDVII